ncbi:MAG: sulfotransferase family protein [Chloroflexota bacterium]
MPGPVSKKIHHLFRLGGSAIRALGKPKIFCVGRNKTGTTSLAKALAELGIIVGEQRLAERLIHDWGRRDFRRLFWYCHTAQAFQDVPFSWAFTFQALDQHFPGSKFILTVRDNPEQWYHSLVSFHARVFGNGKTVTADDLRRSDYVYPGWAYEALRLNWGSPETDIYHRETLIAGYNAHNGSVLEYFRHRPGDLLVLNVGQPGAYQALCAFLGKPCPNREFPWENRTVDVKRHPETARNENG